jgi:hypothetical protein
VTCHPVHLSRHSDDDVSCSTHSCLSSSILLSLLAPRLLCSLVTDALPTSIASSPTHYCLAAHASILPGRVSLHPCPCLLSPLLHLVVGPLSTAGVLSHSAFDSWPCSAPPSTLVRLHMCLLYSLGCFLTSPFFFFWTFVRHFTPWFLDWYTYSVLLSPCLLISQRLFPCVLHVRTLLSWLPSVCECVCCFFLT